MMIVYYVALSGRWVLWGVGLYPGRCPGLGDVALSGRWGCPGVGDIAQGVALG